MDEIARLMQPEPRVRVLRAGDPDPEGKCVLYWMQRAQRALDNPAFEHAIALGNALKLPVIAVFGLTGGYPGAEPRHYRFLVDGLPETHEAMASRGVPLVVRLGTPNLVVAAVTSQVDPAVIVVDENPIRVGQVWRNGLASEVKVPILVVDADVVCPTSLFPKLEFAARTIRPKIHKVWDQYLKPIEPLKVEHPWGKKPLPEGERVDPDTLLADLKLEGAAPVPGYQGGTAEGLRRLKRFVKERLDHYATERNEPTPYMTTELSAHLHFGHISPLTIALAVINSDGTQAAKDVLLEELIVRRELAINFISRNSDYDTLKGCPDWGLKTLAKHADDPRPVLYIDKQLEAGETYDPLWNASQKEMVLTGRMHNYLRMYWAKKILEWSPDAESAFEIARTLNDRYEVDGRDPNGWTGISWAIGGRHDRPWGERPIFGMVRFMSYESTRKKFDSKSYIARVEALERGRPRS